MTDTDHTIKLATDIAFGMFLELSARSPKYVTRREAEKKYKHLLYTWEQRGWVKPIHTMNGKHDVFPEHRLVELYRDYVTGRQ